MTMLGVMLERYGRQLPVVNGIPAYTDQARAANLANPCNKVADVVMPPIGLLVGNIDFSNLFVNLSSTPVASLEEARAAGVPVIAYGSFINTVIDFLIITFVIFFTIRQINRLKRVKSEAEAAPPNRQEVLLEEIRDLLKDRH